MAGRLALPKVLHRGLPMYEQPPERQVLVLPQSPVARARDLVVGVMMFELRIKHTKVGFAAIRVFTPAHLVGCVCPFRRCMRLAEKGVSCGLGREDEHCTARRVSALLW
jgi:hypothetical protein